MTDLPYREGRLARARTRPSASQTPQTIQPRHVSFMHLRLGACCPLPWACAEARCARRRGRCVGGGVALDWQGRRESTGAVTDVLVGGWVGVVDRHVVPRRRAAERIALAPAGNRVEAVPHEVQCHRRSRSESGLGPACTSGSPLSRRRWVRVALPLPRAMRQSCVDAAR